MYVTWTSTLVSLPGEGLDLRTLFLWLRWVSVEHAGSSCCGQASLEWTELLHGRGVSPESQSSTQAPLSWWAGVPLVVDSAAP